ncbi:MAG: SLC13 family permease [Candidatus Methylacidiphilales bacterium]
MEMLLMLLILGVLIAAFIREWAPPDVVALGGFCLVILTGLISVEQGFKVFSNQAPLAVAAMFILSAALTKTGAIDGIGRWLGNRLGGNLFVILPAVMVLVAFCSAFINNTPVVAIFMPILIHLARSKDLPASKLLIPLSYAAILGGCCTLIGTSTNIVVSGIAANSYQLAPIGMFELAAVGIPFVILGIIYMTLFGTRLLPARQTVTALLTPDDRRNFLCQVLVKKDSPLVGQRLVDTELAQKKSDFRIIEVRRRSARVMQPIDEIVVEPFDRILISASAKQMVELPQVKGIELASETRGRLGLENLSTIEGAIVEGIIAPHSKLIGKTIKSINFRQTYGIVILAVHRHGKNLSSQFQDEVLEFGDTLLMMGAKSTFEQMAEGSDFMFLEDRMPLAARRDKAWIAWACVAGVVLVASLELMPIAFAAILACLVLLLTGTLKSDEAYGAVDWPIIVMIYGMLGVGLAMEETGSAAWLANHLTNIVGVTVPSEWVPYILLSMVYLLTSTLTEVMSNNATAALATPIAINCALNAGLDPRPFIIAVCFGASASFVTPIGYQTNTMVYGPGGYRFSDFVRVGLPLNVLFWLGASILIPLFWKF